MAPIKFEQLVSNPHELFFYPINSISSILLFCGISSCVFVETEQGKTALGNTIYTFQNKK